MVKKISESEIVTPQQMCESMVDLLPYNELITNINNGKKIIDKL